MHPDIYTVSLPYPVAHPERQDLRLAQRLFPLYIGADSELASLSDYLYIALRTETSHPELANIFDAVARTELQHFRLLGGLLRDLGANPAMHTRIDTARLSPDSSDSHALREIFSRSLHAEQTAADNYRYLMEQTDDEAVCNLLYRIMLDEEAHIRLFTALLN